MHTTGFSEKCEDLASQSEASLTAAQQLLESAPIEHESGNAIPNYSLTRDIRDQAYHVRKAVFERNVGLLVLALAQSVQALSARIVELESKTSAKGVKRDQR